MALLEDRKVILNQIPITIAPCAVSPDGVKVVPPPWDECDYLLYFRLTGICFLCSSICFLSYSYGYYQPTVQDEDLLQLLLLSAMFIGIGCGLLFFCCTRQFYRAEDVLRALKAAHKTQAARMKKLSKSNQSATDTRRSSKPGSRRSQGKR
eukprot:m.228851 g.228851  ORF g.228851 m.228851 type:complete len:151 (+) comp15673_c0_seq15:288-740(+)